MNAFYQAACWIVGLSAVTAVVRYVVRDTIRTVRRDREVQR